MRRTLSAILAAILAAGLPAAARAAAAAPPAPWPQELYNPQPADGDLDLPMPCGGRMTFRPVAVPGKDALDDRRIAVGNVEERYGFKENQRAEFIAGGFSGTAQSGRVYYIGKYEVTRLQAAALGGECGPPDDEARLPQTAVTWYAASAFADGYTQWLLANARDKLPAEAGQPGFLRLPTESEWEFAARGGARVADADFAAPVFPMEGGLAEYVWYGGPESSSNELQWIGLLKPNPLGLHDILGNAGELVFDLFRLNHLSRLHGQAGGFIVRGGDYLASRNAVRTAARDEYPPYDKDGPRRQKTVGFRLALVPSVLPSPERVRQVQTLWTKLPEAAGTGLAEPVQDDPLKEVDILARAVPDPSVKQRLQGLRNVIAANVKTRNDQRDRAARASLNLATWLAGNLRIDTRKVLGLEEAIALGNEGLKRRLPGDVAALRGVIGYYRDTLRYLIDEYAENVRKEQAEVLRQELEQRGATAQVAMVTVVERDSARYRKEGNIPAEQVETELRRDLCGGEVGQYFPKACAPYRR